MHRQGFTTSFLLDRIKGGLVFSCSPECTPDADGNVSLPQCGSLDIYDAGFECQNNSSRNQHGKELDLRWGALDDPSSGVSTLTLLASCRRIRGLQPRVFRLENVRNCKMSRVLDFLKLQFPEYEIEVIEGDCADYNGKTERYRKWVVGV